MCRCASVHMLYACQAEIITQRESEVLTYNSLMAALICFITNPRGLAFAGHVQVAVQDNAWIFFLLWAISFVAVLALANSPRVRRTHPYNFMTWIIFTLSFALIVGTITSLFRTDLLLMALGLTAAAVAFIFLIAAATDFDFTQAGWPSAVFFLVTRQY